jgi:toxin YoeB
VNLLWTARGWSDYLFWQTSDRDILTKINTLIDDTMRHPFQGLGKPEPLRGEYSGWSSRRVTGEHRLIYRVTGSGGAQRIEIVACRYHY